jgi:hypothetical protein
VLFKGKHFVRFDPSAGGGALVPMETKGVWGRVNNPFLASPGSPRPPIDAAFVAPDRALYVFQGNRYLRYENPSAEFADEGYPRAIRDRWGDLPADPKPASTPDSSLPDARICAANIATCATETPATV